MAETDERQPCGEPTKGGGICNRRVLEPPCWQHQGDGILPYKFDESKRDEYLDHLRNGKNRGAAASAVGIHRTTIHDYLAASPDFAHECKVAENDAIAEVEDVLRETALSGNTTALIFYLTNRAHDRWSDKRNFAGKVVAPDTPQADGVGTAAVDPGLSLAAFAEDVLGVHLSDMQLAMASLVLANQRSAIAGCHASGKTYLFAILVVWWLYRYDDGIVSIVATRELQTDHLWGWVTTFWNTCPRLRSALGSDARLLANSLTVSPRRYAERTAAGVSTTGGVAQATGIQGIHSEHVLHVFEEADGIHDAVYRAKEGSMTSVGNKLAMLFNPLRRTGPAYQAMRSEQFAKMNISGFDSPNLAGETLETFLERYHADPDDPWFHEPDVFPGLTGRLWLRDLYQRCGQWEDQEWYGRGLGAYAPSALNSIFDVDAGARPRCGSGMGAAGQTGPNWHRLGGRPRRGSAGHCGIAGTG